MFTLRFQAAVALIAQTPGYASVAHDLQIRFHSGRVRFVPGLADRGQATLSGVLLIGPEAADGSTLGFAETLVHEQYHLHQFPLLKTVSFWAGITTRTPTMRRYEKPAYRAAYHFLLAVAQTLPDLQSEARQEMAAVASVFASEYGEPLFAEE